ncbi:branched-chain amino acid aminotransferase [Rhodococcus triatomae]|uniref:Branched-chain amino acid aminotransferase n=1 Tax=Rhodococcus triatomae TaxID=300028 RepID=A0A1G8PIT8_9NOCA|nr:aminotransferase class IV [Rhodococcus triatomae]QNG20100.1 branched-chain amino acid aminotransferase [Rhodococcus triatomae]QNG23984.1 branched-chain amino acid aminotransferase [Rhodococcus triatomae]SDI91730.1 branched-chain amino acid aminotransferase [Rhodococcus triatomae]
MAEPYSRVFFGDRIVDADQAKLGVATSAMLYGLSVYTVFPVQVDGGTRSVFRLADHFQRLVESCKIIGIDRFAGEWDFERFAAATRELVAENDPQRDVFVRASVHVDESIPGTRVRGCGITVSMFVYDAVPIVPQDGMRLKTSQWRRIPDDAIPSRAKVNGAYVNSVLAKQDAIDAGYDDAIFLDTQGHVCELSAANIFLVRGGTVVTPDVSSDILDGINRRTILTLAAEDGIPVVERAVDLTELYIADEVFVTGTSAGVSPVIEVDGRAVGDGRPGPISGALRKRHTAALRTDVEHGWVTPI